MICPQCQTPNRDSAKFCDECGWRLAEATSSSIPAVVADETHEDVRAAALADLPQTIEEPAGDAVVDSWFDASVPESVEETVESVEEAHEAETGKSGELDLPEIEPKKTQTAADLSGFVFADSSADASENVVAGAGAFNSFETASIPLSSVWGAGNTAAMPKIEGIPSAEAVSVHAPASKKEERERKRAMKKKEREARKQLKDAQNASNGKGRRTALIAALGIIIAAALVAGLTYYCEVWGGKTVPSTQGMSVADATYTLQSEGFTVTVSNVKSDDTEGLVLLSDPSSGSRVPQGSEIVIHVAESRVIPAVVGMHVDKARPLFDEQGFTGVEYVEKKTVEAEEGTVLSVSPEAGTKAKSKAQIVVEIAVPFRVPDVSGMSSGNATQTLIDAGFNNVYVSEVENSEVAEGTVFASSPTKDTVLDPNEFVTIYVAVQRASILVNAATNYLMTQGVVQSGMYSYVIDGIQSVTYSGNGVVSYTITSSSVVLPIFGPTPIPTQTVVGSITFDEYNQIVSVG